MQPKLYLSPSCQERNLGADGVTEEARMRGLALKMRPLIEAQHIAVVLNAPEMTLSQVIKDSNNYRPNLHLALHSNAGTAKTTGRASGVEAWAYPGTACTERLGTRIATIVHQLTGLPIRRGLRHGFVKYIGVDGPRFDEIEKTNAPAVLIELFFHDRQQDIDAYLKAEDRLAAALSGAVVDSLYGRDI